MKKFSIATHQNAQLCHSTPAAWLADGPVNHCNSWLIGVLSCAAGMALQCSGRRLCTAPRLGGQMHNPGKAPGPRPRCTMGRSRCVLGFGGWAWEGHFITHPSHSMKRSGVLRGRQDKGVHFSSSCTITVSAFHFYSGQAWDSRSENEAWFNRKETKEVNFFPFFLFYIQTGYTIWMSDSRQCGKLSCFY